MSIYTLFLISSSLIYLCEARKCAPRLSGSHTFNPNDIESDVLAGEEPMNGKGSTSLRVANNGVYFWPSLTKAERSVIRDAIHQISRRTCIKFNELEYKPWYDADRWTDKPYIVIKKSKKFSGYSDNDIEGVAKRSLLYISEGALSNTVANNSRGMVMAQMLKFMGLREEWLRPDAASYIQPIDAAAEEETLSREMPFFTEQQLQWPFDPESITIPSKARKHYRLTVYCPARSNSDIGAGQRTGLLTRWDAVKLNSMYCLERVGSADPRRGPCVVERPKQRQ